MQSNAEALLDRKLRRRTLRAIKSGIVSFIGTDCHNMSGRAPNIGPAFDEIRRSLGEETEKYLIGYQEKVFGRAGTIY